MDKIHLRGMRVYGYTGALPEERVLGQWFEVALTLWVDLTIAGQSDRLADTCDYRAVIAVVQQQVKTGKYQLLERLATAIADNILQLDPAAAPPIEQVRVAVTKVAVPIPDFGGQVGVEITRSRTATL